MDMHTHMHMDMDMDMGMHMHMHVHMHVHVHMHMQHAHAHACSMPMQMHIHGSHATCSAVGLTCSCASTSAARLSHCASGETPPSGGGRCISDAENRPGDGATREVAGPEGASRRSRNSVAPPPATAWSVRKEPPSRV